MICGKGHKGTSLGNRKCKEANLLRAGACGAVMMPQSRNDAASAPKVVMARSTAARHATTESSMCRKSTGISRTDNPDSTHRRISDICETGTAILPIAVTDHVLSNRVDIVVSDWAMSARLH